MQEIDNDELRDIRGGCKIKQERIGIDPQNIINALEKDEMKKFFEEVIINNMNDINESKAILDIMIKFSKLSKDERAAIGNLISVF